MIDQKREAAEGVTTAEGFNHASCGYSHGAIDRKTGDVRKSVYFYMNCVGKG
jgi:hypothetical protein